MDAYTPENRGLIPRLITSNSIETIRAGVLAGFGIGLFTKALLVGELASPNVVTVLDGFVRGTRDVNVVWPKRRFVPARVRRTTEFFADTIPKRLFDSGHVHRTSMVLF
ncbi:LysR substrate-binding domain-containing protein [Lichenihabitans sp. Uapishka_5]|uniref:LysR substrate-binding domain-containing protein n=1 Tax=Lichenihabitans sp. Uapishka_5 TaxID=3037302 RepID=UPI0029E80999|nr:LysR substrate-binding domain-containing protein [Lichenihabitans sp. Uapishka_5]MDX7954024.1 LysR substrate-binding domain-containing protein [Lichenihabitans sp. Uapishka_5]